jgi:hypothetical protein
MYDFMQTTTTEQNVEDEFLLGLLDIGPLQPSIHHHCLAVQP